MPDWAVHTIVPLFALLLVSQKENPKYILYLLPLALIPDLDHFAFMHRALLHNIFIPLIFLGTSVIYRDQRTRFLLITGAVYTASHVILDMFNGGVGLFYPLTSNMFFINAELSYRQGFSWVLNWGVAPYSDNWILANGYVINSVGAASITFLLMAGMCLYYRNRSNNDNNEVLNEA